MRILFQGDSITDTLRVREDSADMGKGYPLLVKASLGKSEPGKHEFINRGISGNRIVDIYARIKADIINLKPDYMSILVGVNDVWHEMNIQNGVDDEKYFKIYCMLIEEIKEALQDIKIAILEPYVLKASATEAKWDKFSTEVAKRAASAKKVAEKYGLIFVPLQAGFDKLCESAHASYWLYDGVHPTPTGHEFIKEEWMKAYLNSQ